MAPEFWSMIYWLDPCKRLGGYCLSDVTVFHDVTDPVAELHSKMKNRAASWENGEQTSETRATS